MRHNFTLSRVCGHVYGNGNLCFSSDGNSVVSAVGNRLTVYDLVRHTSWVLPFENRKNIQLVTLSNNGRFLISVDVEGHALFINFPRRIILHRFHFKRKVKGIKFSPDDELFAVTHGHGSQVWKSPSARREFSPLTLKRTLGGHSDEVTCLDWSTDSQSVATGSKDLQIRVYYRMRGKHMAHSVLTGHRDKVVGVFFADDGERLYSVARDGAIFVWEFEAGERTGAAGLFGCSRPGEKSHAGQGSFVGEGGRSEGEEEEWKGCYSSPIEVASRSSFQHHQ